MGTGLFRLSDPTPYTQMKVGEEYFVNGVLCVLTLDANGNRVMKPKETKHPKAE